MNERDPAQSPEKPRYERPALVRHQTGMMNKFARVQSTPPITEIDGASIDELLERYGSPLFVFSERELVSSYRELDEVLRLRVPKARLAWSYKTNYLDAVCRVFHREGALAEVVSEFELDKALRNGVAPQQIHFNGPYKPRTALEKALGAGVIVHIDHFDELALAEQVAEELGVEPEVALRVNMSAEGTPAWTRFGFNLENGQARDAARRILAGGKLRLVGLHCHLGTFILETKAYRDAATKIAKLANELRSELGVIMSFLDLGGGFASHNKLKAQYLASEQATPSFSRYAEAIADGLAALDYPPAEAPTLILETGRALVDDAGYLLTTVQANKRLPDGRRAVILDAGVNVLFTSFWYEHEVVPTRRLRGIPEPTIMYGPLCMNIDVVRDRLVFPPVDVGDHLVMRHVGAYNVTQWMQFITYRPAVVLVGRDGQHALMRRAEDLEYVCAPENIPPWL
jgi:diaminopimelate decarboxylase